ncbi:MAG: glycosyltransferase [Spirochaetota bacterium]|nr:glycosyltransferase [Spirochaetota bacterium]
MNISIVIPSYDGWDRLPALFAEIIRSLSLYTRPVDFEIIIVDDGSLNRSVDPVTELRNKGVNVKGVFLKRNYGQQLATLAGLRVSRGDYIITMDDDLSHNPEDFSKLLSMAEKDTFDAVFGIPENSRTGLLRKGGSGLRDIIFSIFFRMPKGLSVSSFRILSRSLVDRIICDISEYRYLSVEILKHTRSIANIQVKYNREGGKTSRYDFVKLVKLAFSLIRCSGVFPGSIRRSGIASGMEWDLI